MQPVRLPPRLRNALFVGRGGPVSRTLARAIARLPARLGSEVLAYMALGRPRRDMEPVLAERCGARFELDMSDGIDRFLFLDLYERRLREAILAHVRPGELFVDAGASSGMYTLAAAARGASVLAAEPVPVTYARLTRNIALNPSLTGRITAFEGAFSDSSGQITLGGDDLSGNSAQASAHLADALWSITAECRRIDDLVDDGEQRVCLLKADVEGHEMHVLRGAAELFDRRRPRAVAVEMVAHLLRAAGSSAEEVCRWLEERGYRVEGVFPQWPGIRTRHGIPRPVPERFAATVLWTIADPAPVESA